LLFTVVNAGCWGAKFIEMPQRAINTSLAVDTLIAKEKNLQEQLDKLQEELKNQQKYSRREAARSKMDMEELKDQLNAMQQALLENSRLDSFKEEATISSVQRGASFRTANRNEREEQDTIKTAAEYDSLSSDSTAGAAPDSGVVSGPDETPSAGVMYRQIYLDFSRMEYQIALEDSKLFLDEYPDNPLAEDVIFIRGECLIEQEKYFDALKEFSRILKEYPNGKKVPASLLRMAVAYEEIGDSDLAAGIVRRLLRDYPNSEEAAAAEEEFGTVLED